MRLEAFVEVLMAATMDGLGSIVASGEVEGVEVSAHGMAVGSAGAAADAGRWVAAFGGVVGSSAALGAVALATTRAICAMYGAGRGSAADTDAAVRLVWRLCVGAEAPEWELRTASAYWVAAPAGLALHDGTYEDGGVARVWVSTWAEAFARLAGEVAEVGQCWTDEEVGDE
jgi:hypothetical protein